MFPTFSPPSQLNQTMETTSNSKIDSSYSPPPHQPKKIKNTHQIETPKNEEEIPKFPEEIIIEILSRLPVKSLLKFRCVSKSWLSLISTPYFIKTHFKISSKESSFHDQRVLVNNYYHLFSLKLCSVLSLIHEPTTDAFNFDYPNENTNGIVWVVGSCNGLICFAISEKDFYLWNPCTKISNKLPSMDVKRKLCFCNMYGFGYCESNDDYKVIGISCILGNAGVYESVVKLYSLRSNSWKRIENLNGIPLRYSCKFVAGKIHLALSPNLGAVFKKNIVSLDLESEVYGIIEQPNYGDGVLDSPLAVLRGCFSILYNYKTRADVWVMKEYGVKESWTKVVSVPYFNNPKKLLYSRPLCLLPTGEILLVFDLQFLVYDPKDNCLRRPETSNLGRFLQVDHYVESLVSPIPVN